MIIEQNAIGLGKHERTIALTSKFPMIGKANNRKFTSDDDLWC